MPDPVRPGPARPAPLPVAEALAPRLTRVLAPNPSPMTHQGTNTYLLGTREVAVIDPGPDDPAHLEAILRALPKGAEISHILVTHAHLDHTALVPRLQDRTGAPVYAFGDAAAGRSALMQDLAAQSDVGGGEGQDTDFAPDVLLGHGDTVSGADWDVIAHHIPGHTGNHLGFEWDGALFVGDLVMGWASSLVSPPDGDLTDFMASLERLGTRDWQHFHSGHGAVIEAPNARLAELRDHRRGREAQIRAALALQAGRAEDLARRIYTDIPPALLPAASRNVLAHLIDLYSKSIVQPRGPLSAEATFELS
ncbi:Glyoxylase, beta-lactamase superfamily II [Roseivivax lentus]|uniref:Glyoxylase, beta-lactamase superfamily II n=1 Tax=Roseivivax lentus TaxID=633194 RepID=A0A1N7PWL0_9RHOB|nr:MBL fold metallo-hydrolase [Roseivivax lentus]SIT15053.1 Glyoxylase, beta-lactamase superfamily II [Roseivivax lentus]